MRVWVDANPKQICYVTETKAVRVESLSGMRTWTNNEAEYKAVIMALEDLEDITEILSDSQFVVRQINTRLGSSDVQYAIRAEHLKLLANKVLELAKSRVKFTWIPREQNRAGKVLG